MNESLSARAADLASLANYQPDSIVSRTLINKPTGTVTLFAFAAGQSLSEHTAPYDALVHVLDGHAQVMIGGENFKSIQAKRSFSPRISRTRSTPLRISKCS